MPTQYVIDKEGVIRAADVNADYPEPSETLKVLRAIKT